MFRSQGTTPARLKRRRGASVAQLVRTDLDERELGEILTATRGEFHRFAEAVTSNRAAIMQSLPTDDCALPADVLWAAENARDAEIALSPAFEGKR